MLELGYVPQEAMPSFRNLLPELQKEASLVLGLTEERKACGAAALQALEGALEVRSLYVAPEYRRRGGGRMLLEAAEALAAGKWDELWLDYTCTGPDQEALEPFLKKMGYEEDQEACSIRGILLEELFSLPFFDKEGGTAVPFARLDPVQRTAAYQREAAADTALMTRTGFMEGLDDDVSMAALREGQVEAFAAVTPVDAGIIELAWVTSGDPRLLPGLLRSVAAALKEKYAPDTLLVINALTEESADLADALIPTARVLSHSWRKKLY